MPVVRQTEAVGHAVRATNLYISLAEIAALSGQPAYLHASELIWQDAVYRKTYVTGSIGSIRFHEQFVEPKTVRYKAGEIGPPGAMFLTSGIDWREPGIVEWRMKEALVGGQLTASMVKRAPAKTGNTMAKMKTARYWTRGSADAQSPRGERIRTTARGWADDSIASARVRACDIARRVAERIASGSVDQSRYPYGDRPLPEPIIREFTSTSAIVTRNAYGALVLNTGHLLFADIDAKPSPAASSWGQLFSSMFGKAPRATDMIAERLRKVTIGRGRTARLYQTAAGYRLVITDARYAPGSPEAESLLAEYQADPLYVRLCRMQESFRARLTPKPWRCGMPAPPVEFPYETSEARNQYSRWEDEYNEKTREFATCRFLADLGQGYREDEFREVIDFHDRETKATQTLPLA